MNSKKSLLVVALVAMIASFAHAELYLYDNFGGSTVDTDLWTVQATSAGGVTIDTANQQLKMDMNSSANNKYARILFKNNIQLVDASDSYRVAFDMNIYSPSGSRSYTNGLSVGTATASQFTVGQFGNAGGGAAANAFIYPGGSYDGDYSAGWYHYDFTMTSTSQAVAVYVRNVAWDSNPELYVTNGTPVFTKNTTLSIATGTDLSLRFYDEVSYTASGTDPRAVVYMDNVFTSVPEPATMLVTALGGLGCVIIKKRK